MVLDSTVALIIRSKMDKQKKSFSSQNCTSSCEDFCYSNVDAPAIKCYHACRDYICG